jgi:uncharacterized protein YbcI
VDAEGSQRTQQAHAAEDSYRSAIQREIVQLHKKFFGRGPVATKLYVHADCVLVLMFNGHTPSEQVMFDHGRKRSVAQTRVDLSESMKAEYIGVIERHTGRHVVGFLSSSQQDPDLLSQVFVLAPTDLLDAAD